MLMGKRLMVKVIKSMRRSSLIPLLGLVLISHATVFETVRAESLDPRLTKARESFQAGNFALASDRYLDYGLQFPNGSVFHNLSLSYFRENKLGLAIAASMRAHQLRPRDPDVSYNLRFMLGKLQDKLEYPFAPSIWDKVFLYGTATSKEIFYFTLVSFCGAILVLMFRLTQARAGTLLIVGVSGLGLASVYGTLALIYGLKQPQDWGAITSPVAKVYSTPTARNAVAIFELHAGAPFALVEKSGEWVKIQLSDSKMGWVAIDQLAVFGGKIAIVSRNAKLSDESGPAL